MLRKKQSRKQLEEGAEEETAAEEGVEEVSVEGKVSVTILNNSRHFPPTTDVEIKVREVLVTVGDFIQEGQTLLRNAFGS